MAETKNLSDRILDGIRNPKITHKDRKQASVHRREFINNVVAKLNDYLDESTEERCKIIEFKQPEELEALIDFKINEEGEEDTSLLAILDNVLRYSIKAHNPKFINQLYSGCDPYSLTGDFIATATNGNMATFEMVPVYLTMEKQFLRFLADLVQWETVDGIFAPGGTYCNYYGINLSRFRKFPDVKTEGNGIIGKVALLTSEHAHYSIPKAAALMGIGTKSVVYVECDERGCMKPAVLEKEILALKEKNITPLFVNATMGTTVVGTIDPLDEIVAIAKKYDIWVHADCSLGTPLIFSESKKDLVAGLKNVDSISFDFHKHLSIPFQASVFLTPHVGLMKNAHSYGATYLFQQDKTAYDIELDTGDKGLQTGRHVDIMKTWLFFKGKGLALIRYEIERCFEMALYWKELVDAHENFEMIYDVQYVQTCFFYIPPSMMGKPRDDEFYKKLDTIAPLIKGKMVDLGDILIGYQPDHKYCNFWRTAVVNPAVTREDIDVMFAHIHDLGKDL